MRRREVVTKIRADTEEDEMTTAIMGIGTIGTIVARNLVRGGERVVLANRDKSKADKLAAELGDLASSAEVGDAISRSDVVVLAVYFDVIKFFIPEFGEKLVGKIVVDPSNPLGPDGKGGFKKITPADQSSGQIIAHMLPNGAKFVKAMICPDDWSAGIIFLKPPLPSGPTGFEGSTTILPTSFTPNSG